jgi:phosphatidylinositol alpha-1,6-mannosyltransferase
VSGEVSGNCLLIANIYAPIRGGSASVYATLAAHAPAGRMAVLASRHHYESDEEIPGWDRHDAGVTYPIERVRLLRPAEMPPPRNRLVSALRFATIDLPLRIGVAWRTLSMIRRHRISVVCLGELNSLAWLGEVCRRLAGSKVVCYIHGEEITTSMSQAGSFGLRRARTLQRADAIIAVSRFTRDALVSQMGVDPARICLLENGVDTRRFAPGPVDEAFRARHGLNGKRVVLEVGRLVARKGFDRTVDAWPQILAAVPDAHLLIVGEGPLGPALRARAEQLGVSSSITFAGALDDADLLAAYRSADLFAMPNRTMPDGDTEGFGLVFLEANACGRAVVGGRAGGAVEAVRDGESGLLVESEQPENIARAIISLLTDDALRQRLEAGGLRHAQANSWSHRITTFTALCDSLVAPGPKEVSAIQKS